MKISNKTRKALLADKVEVATRFWKKTIGLMFRSGIDDSAGFLMEFEREGFYGVWMLGMRFAIDLIFMDSEKRIVEAFENIKPVGINPGSWRVYSPGKTARWVLELKAGRIRKTKTSTGDRLSFE